MRRTADTCRDKLLPLVKACRQMGLWLLNTCRDLPQHTRRLPRIKPIACTYTVQENPHQPTCTRKTCLVRTQTTHRGVKILYITWRTTYTVCRAHALPALTAAALEPTSTTTEAPTFRLGPPVNAPSFNFQIILARVKSDHSAYIICTASKS